jgi:aspartyl/asparaginyl-tRNA synthetase
MIASVDKGINHQTQITQLYRQQPHKQDANNMLEWVKNLLEGRKIELKNILRWEDDSGQIVEVNVSTIYLHSN